MNLYRRRNLIAFYSAWQKMPRMKTLLLKIQTFGTARRFFQNKSRLLKLSASRNYDSLVAIGGRLNISELPDVTKKPIVLSNDSHLSSLLVKNANHRILHGSIDLTIAHVRQCFWILNVRDLVRKVLHNCVVCTRYAIQKHTHDGRFTLGTCHTTKPFTHAGVDFAGPFELRKSERANKSKEVSLLFRSHRQESNSPRNCHFALYT